MAEQAWQMRQDEERRWQHSVTWQVTKEAFIYIPASARKLQIFEERFIDAVQTDENTSKATQLFFKRMKLISERNKGFYAECD